MGRLTGRTIILYDKVQRTVEGSTDKVYDSFGRPVYDEVPVVVENVLIGTPSAQEIIDTLNLTGKRAAYTLGIPKGDTHTWTDRKVEFFGETFHTIGYPIRGQEELVPLNWDQNVMVERYG